jgi:uncharacterized protein (TIGR00369 family)
MRRLAYAQAAMPDMLAIGRALLATQPFNAVLGAELASFSEGRAELRLRITDQLKQQNGFVHGGVIGCAADNAISFVGGSVLGMGVVTSDLTIHYLRPALGEWLVARATLVGSTRNRAICRCDIFAISPEGERLCATAQGNIARLGQPRSDGGR